MQDQKFKRPFHDKRFVELAGLFFKIQKWRNGKLVLKQIIEPKTTIKINDI